MAHRRQMQNTSLKHLRMSLRADVITCNFTTLRSRNWETYINIIIYYLWNCIQSIELTWKSKNSNFSCRCCKLTLSDIGFYFFLAAQVHVRLRKFYWCGYWHICLVSALRMSYCKRAKCSIFMVLLSVNMINSPWSVVRVRLIIQRSLSRL
jgi:hypothetical protein